MDPSHQSQKGSRVRPRVNGVAVRVRQSNSWDSRSDPELIVLGTRRPIE